MMPMLYNPYWTKTSGYKPDEFLIKMFKMFGEKVDRNKPQIYDDYANLFLTPIA